MLNDDFHTKGLSRCRLIFNRTSHLYSYQPTKKTWKYEC